MEVGLVVSGGGLEMAAPAGNAACVCLGVEPAAPGLGAEIIRREMRLGLGFLDRSSTSGTDNLCRWNAGDEWGWW